MPLKLKPKSFGPIIVSFDGSPQLSYAHGDDFEATPYPPVTSPVDTMIAALGACIIRSMEWAANERKVALHPFQVRIVAHKSTQLPGRVEKAHISVVGRFVDDEALAPRLLKQAKAICTVSNSLNTEVEISFQP